MGENFDVTWGGFANNFRESFFKKFGAELDFSDVTLACEGGQVEAHRVVPAAGSPHLHALLKRNPDHRFIYLRGVALPDLKDVVSFLYRGYMTVTTAVAATTAAAAATTAAAARPAVGRRRRRGGIQGRGRGTGLARAGRR